MKAKLLATTAAVAFAIATAQGPALAQVSGDAEASVGGGVDAGIGASIGGGGGVSAGAGASVGGDGSTAGVGASVGVGGIGVDAGTDAGLNAGVDVNGDVGATVGATVGVDGVTAPAPVSGQALASVDASLLIGASAVSADGAIIGTVTDVSTDANGELMVTIDLADNLGLSLDAIRVGAEFATFVDQQILLNTTQASLVASLEAQFGAGADADANLGATIGGAQGAIGSAAPGAQAGLTGPSRGAGLDGIGSLASLSDGDLRSTLAGLGAADLSKLKTACSDVLSNPSAYSAETRAVCEVIASI